MKPIAYFFGALFCSTTLFAQENIALHPATISTGINPTTLWALIQSGGWVMIPLGALSVITLMLVMVFLLTMRRSAIVSAHFMNTADVLLKTRDYLGLLAISSNHNEAVARILHRTLDFTTKNPTAELAIVREIAETEGSTQAASHRGINPQHPARRGRF